MPLIIPKKRQTSAQTLYRTNKVVYAMLLSLRLKRGAVLTDKTGEVYDAIRRKISQAAPYILTNAHRKRVLIRLNAREMYHISRLREDAHSQWDIQNIARAMSNKAKLTMPLVFAFLGGKDKYNEIYQNIFGQAPKVAEAMLPGARKIKG